MNGRHITSLTPPLFLNVCTKTGKWEVMHFVFVCLEVLTLALSPFFNWFWICSDIGQDEVAHHSGKTLQSAQTQYWWLIKYQYKLDGTSQHVKFNSETKHQRKPNWQKIVKKTENDRKCKYTFNAILKIYCYIVICCQYVMNISFVIWYDDIRVRGVKGFYFPINCQWQINSWYWSELYTDGLRLGLESNLFDRLSVENIVIELF